MKIFNENINNVPVKIISTNKFKFVNFELYFTRKLDYKDIAPYNLLVMILTTRNNKYPSISEFSKYKENNYGLSVNASYTNRGNISVFNFRVNLINSKFSLNEDLLSKEIEAICDCLYNPSLTEEALCEVKDIYISKLKDKLNKKTYILKKKINDVLGNDNPYGVNIESNIDDISSVTLDDVKRVYDNLFTSKLYVYVVGEVDKDEIINKLSFLRTTSNEDILDLSYLKEIEKKDNVFESNFLQSAISLIYECNINYNDRLYYPLKVFIEMLNYDLFNVIREKYNYCYYIYALSNNYLNNIEIVSEIESKNFNDVIRLIDEIIKGYDSKSEEEFIISRDKIISYINSSLDNSRDLSSLYFGFDFNCSVASIEELKEKYNNVSLNDIVEVSKTLTLKMTSILKEGNHE